MVYVDEEVFLYLTEGINVYPSEIKNVLRLHPDIADCAVFGVQDRHWEEAVVVLNNTKINKIQAHCRKHLSGFRCPRAILAVSEMPHNFAQKIIRKDLISL